MALDGLRGASNLLREDIVQVQSWCACCLACVPEHGERQKDMSRRLTQWVWALGRKMMVATLHGVVWECEKQQVEKTFPRERYRALTCQGRSSASLFWDDGVSGARGSVSYAWLAGGNVRPTVRRKTAGEEDSSVECSQEARQEASSQQTPVRKHREPVPEYKKGRWWVISKRGSF